MKKNKIVKKIVITCILLIAIELITMFVMKIFRERDIDHVDIINDLISVDDG